MPWLLELSYAQDSFSPAGGNMRVDYQGWRSFLIKHGSGTHELLRLSSPLLAACLNGSRSAS